MNHDWYAAAKTSREKRRQHDDLKCGEAHPRKSHAQWGRELTEMWETHRGTWRRTRRRSTAGDHSPDDRNTYCEVVHQRSSHEEWFDQHTWTEPGTGRSFYWRVREYIRREVDAATRIYRWFIAPTGVIIMVTLFVVFLVLWEKYEDYSNSLPTHDEWYVVAKSWRSMAHYGLNDYYTIRIERQPSEPKDAPREGAYIVPLIVGEPCIEDVLAQGVGHRLPDSCEQHPKDLIDGVLNK